MKLVINPQRMSMRDMEDFEDVSGRPIGEFMEKFQGRRGEEISIGEFSAKMLTAMIWVFGRQSEPGLTLDQVRDMALEDFELDVPLDGAAKAAGSNGSRGSRASTASRRRISGI